MHTKPFLLILLLAILRRSTDGGSTWSAEADLSTYVPGYSYITPDGFSFPFGDYFELDIDDQGATQAVWGEGLITIPSARSGIRRETRRLRQPRMATKYPSGLFTFKVSDYNLNMLEYSWMISR